MLMEHIKYSKPAEGYTIVGYVTLTTIPDGIVSYGLFDTLMEAQRWAVQLNNATIQAVYQPAYNRG